MRRRRPGTESRATSTTSTLLSQSTAAAKADFDFDRHVVDRVDDSIWRALFNGDFRLAVRCDVCGRWLTANTPKKAHRGPRCAAKAVTS